MFLLPTQMGFLCPTEGEFLCPTGGFCCQHRWGFCCQLRWSFCVRPKRVFVSDRGVFAADLEGAYRLANLACVSVGGPWLRSASLLGLLRG